MTAPDVLSWDYNTAQWVIAIIVGICLAKIYACVAHHMKSLKKTEYYLPYIVMILELFVMLVFMWFSSPYGYYIVTGSKLGFICRTLTDSLVVIVALVSLPDDDILEKGIREYDSIQCLIKPSYKLIAVISNILINLVDIILNEIKYQRFPKLSILIKEYINNIINIQTKKIQSEVSKLIHIEENYIWTEDKNFINNLKNIYIKYKEPNDIKIIEELINQYFDTVKFTFNNNIPKIIMYSLVLKVEKEVFSNLFLFISNKLTPEEILKEPNEIDKERKKLEHFRTKLITAQRILTTS